MIKKPSLNQIRPFYQYLRKQADNKKFIKYLEVTATFSLIAIFLFLAIQPTALAISSLLGEIKSKQLSQKKMTAQINTIIQAQDSFAKAQERYDLIESAFPTNPAFYESALNLASLSQKSSVKVNKLSFDVVNEESKKNKNTKSKEEDLTDSFQADLSINSSYQQALSLIQDLANNRRLIDISSIQFTRPDKNKKDEALPSNSININLSTNLFYSPINEKN